MTNPDDLDPHAPMTVAQLIEALGKFPPGMPVFKYDEFLRAVNEIELCRAEPDENSLSGWYWDAFSAQPQNAVML